MAAMHDSEGDSKYASVGKCIFFSRSVNRHAASDTRLP